MLTNGIEHLIIDLKYPGRLTKYTALRRRLWRNLMLLLM